MLDPEDQREQWCSRKTEILPSDPRDLEDLLQYRRNQAKIAIQDERLTCSYCDTKIGAIVRTHGKIVVLRLNFDHFIPRSRGGSDEPENIIISCHICNAFKRDKVFRSLNEARQYLTMKWTEKKVRLADRIRKFSLRGKTLIAQRRIERRLEKARRRVLG